MSEDNLALVNTVKRYPCLYNFGIPEYMKKEDTDSAWAEVASQMRQTVHECKEKWRNLRYSFLRSLKPHPDGSAKKKYYLHKEMEFLLPFMKTRFDVAVAQQFEDDSDDDTNTDVINEDEPIISEEQVNHLEYCALEFTEPLPKRRKTMHRSTRDSGNSECPRKMFLLSLIPEINSLSEVQMKAFRRNVFKMIDDLTQNNSSSNSTADGQNNLHKNGPSSLENTEEKNYSETEQVTFIKSEII